MAEKSKKEKQESNNEQSKELEESKKKMDEYLSTLQHLQAEFENYRKRVEREKESFCKFASRAVIEELIPVIDDFDLTMKKKDSENLQEFVKAIEMVHDKLWMVLKNQGLSVIQAEGQPFNPELHEPLLMEESEKQENTVLEVIQTGYLLNGKVLRHSRVKVSKPKKPEQNSEQKK